MNFLFSPVDDEDEALVNAAANAVEGEAAAVVDDEAVDIFTHNSVLPSIEVGRNRALFPPESSFRGERKHTNFPLFHVSVLYVHTVENYLLSLSLFSPPHT